MRLNLLRRTCRPRNLTHTPIRIMWVQPPVIIPPHNAFEKDDVVGAICTS